LVVVVGPDNIRRYLSEIGAPGIAQPAAEQRQFLRQDSGFDF